MDALLVDSGESDVKIAVLDCRQGDRTGYLGVYLRELAEDEYCRIRCSELAMCEARVVEQLQPKARQIFIHHYGPLDDEDRWEHRIVIDTSSLALQGFTLTSCQISEPRKLLPERDLDSDELAAKRNVLRSGELQADLEGQSSLKLRSQKGGPACAIITLQDPQKGDAFVLLIECVDGQVGANIVLLEDSSFEPLRVDRLFQNRQYLPLYEHRADRVSRWMWSDRSVSVQLLNLNRKDGPYFRGPYHLARLSIDTHGGLPWPDIDNDNYITKDHKIFKVVEKGRPQEYWAHTRFINFTDDEEQPSRIVSTVSREVEDLFEAAKQYLARYEWCQRFFEWWPSRSADVSPSTSPPAPPYMGRDLLSLYAGVEVQQPSRRQIEMDNIAESFLWRHDVQGRLRSLSASDGSSISSDESSLLDTSDYTTEDESPQIGSPKLQYWRDGMWTKDAEFIQRESERQDESIPCPISVGFSKQKDQISEAAYKDLLDKRYSPDLEWVCVYPESTGTYDPVRHTKLELSPPAPPYQLIDAFNIDGDVRIFPEELIIPVFDRGRCSYCIQQEEESVD